MTKTKRTKRVCEHKHSCTLEGATESFQHCASCGEPWENIKRERSPEEKRLASNLSTEYNKSVGVAKPSEELNSRS